MFGAFKLDVAAKMCGAVGVMHLATINISQLAAVNVFTPGRVVAPVSGPETLEDRVPHQHVPRQTAVLHPPVDLVVVSRHSATVRSSGRRALDDLTLRPRPGPLPVSLALQPGLPLEVVVVPA